MTDFGLLLPKKRIWPCAGVASAGAVVRVEGGKAALDSGLCGLGQISYGLGVLCVEGWVAPCL